MILYIRDFFYAGNSVEGLHVVCCDSIDSGRSR